ncbi:MAG: response regulator [Bdellovibrionales bacterium]
MKRPPFTPEVSFEQLTRANKELSRLVAEKDAVAERLRESQSFLDSVIEHLPNMIFVKDALELRFVRFNKAGEELLGQARENLIGKNDYDLFPKDQADFFTEKDRTVLMDKIVVDIPEESISTPKGTRILHTRKIPLFDKNGVPQYLLGISEDITEKKESELQKLELLQSELARQEAERSASRLSFLAEASAALNESLETEYMLSTFANSLIQNMAGWCLIDIYSAKDQTIKRLATWKTEVHFSPIPPHSFLKHKIDKLTTGGVLDVLQTGQPKLYKTLSSKLLRQLTFNNASLNEAILKKKIPSAIIVPLIYHGSTLGAITLFSQDSEHIYNELDLSIAQDLARRASLAIENTKLYARANEASRAKSAFLANISHEIRTPLSAMLGFAELALDNDRPMAEQKRYVSKIVENGTQLLQLVNEVLDLSKVESSQLQVEKIEFSLSKLLDDVTSLLQVKANEKGLHLMIEGDSTLPNSIISDPFRIRQILINVIGNAVKFTSKGSVHVSVMFQTESASKGTLVFSVQDTGIGIAPMEAEKLFEPFRQADESVARKYGGTGLGLFLSRKLSRLLGGDLSLELSVPQQGSKFKLTLPVEYSTKRAPGIPPQDLQKHPCDIQSLSGKILVVEDSLDNQLLVKAFLEKTEVSIDFANNGNEGLSKALANHYDIVMMDIQMPEMDGFEAVKRLRDLGYQGCVVALTAHGMKGDRERCLEQGFDDYICKPFSRSMLTNFVNQHLLN